MTPAAIEIERKLKRDCQAVDVFVSDDPSGFIVCGFINGMRVIRLQAATVKGAIGKFRYCVLESRASRAARRHEMNAASVMINQLGGMLILAGISAVALMFLCILYCTISITQEKRKRDRLQAQQDRRWGRGCGY